MVTNTIGFEEALSRFHGALTRKIQAYIQKLAERRGLRDAFEKAVLDTLDEEQRHLLDTVLEGRVYMCRGVSTPFMFFDFKPAVRMPIRHSRTRYRSSIEEVMLETPEVKKLIDELKNEYYAACEAAREITRVMRQNRRPAAMIEAVPMMADLIHDAFRLGEGTPNPAGLLNGKFMKQTYKEYRKLLDETLESKK